MPRVIVVVCALAMAVDAGAEVSSRARALLDRAEARYEADDRAGALEAYLAAVQIDRSAESLDRIQKYLPLVQYMTTPEEKAAAEKGEQLARTALRQYVEQHPLEWEAVNLLTIYADAPEREKVLERYRAGHPDDPRLYNRRGGLRQSHGRYAEALADFQKVIDLEPANPEHHYFYGVVAYEAVAKADLPEYIAPGLAAFDRAIATKPDYMEAMVYRSLLMREQAKREKDPAKQKRLIAEADALRAKAQEIVKKRKAALRSKRSLE